MTSHAWLHKNDADPDQRHMNKLLSRVERRLYPVSDAEAFWIKRILTMLLNIWRRYYYLYAEGDVLVFFDMSSLTQVTVEVKETEDGEETPVTGEVPRKPHEEREFQEALQGL